MSELINNWNSRYSADGYAYGELPNEYFKEQLSKLPAGKILLPGEGEGRNAVYAAQEGWEVFAYDLSSEGKIKAENLVAKHNVHIDYRVGDVKEHNYLLKQFDVIALIYLHLPKYERSYLNESIYDLLRPGGVVIAELFSKNHIAYQKRNSSVGGPRDVASLYSVEEIKTDFKDFSILELKEEEIELREGKFHNGSASVIRFVGKK